MPIFEYECCGRFDGITTIKDHDVCPTCGNRAKKVQGFYPFSASYNSSFIDVDTMNPGDRAALLDHKRYIESRKDDVKSGALKIKEAGPKALRPVL